MALPCAQEIERSHLTEELVASQGAEPRYPRLFGCRAHRWRRGDRGRERKSVTRKESAVAFAASATPFMNVAHACVRQGVVNPGYCLLCARMFVKGGAEKNGRQGG